MNGALPPCPQPPDWKIDWPTIDAYAWIAELKNCPQNPVRHAEGDVWIHVHMVCEAMAALPAWRELPEAQRQTLFTAALLHDVAKPMCTRVEHDGSISSRGHSWRGAVRARGILWRRNIPFAAREQIAAIVRHHLVPFFLADSENPHRLAVEVSQTAPCDWLAIMAESDARGRLCPDPDRLLKQIEQFRALCREFGCLSRPYAFSSDDERFLFFRDTNRPANGTGEIESADVQESLGSPGPPRSTGCEAIIMCGLPGSGKDYWLRKNMSGTPLIGLDALRIELGVPASDPHGTVLNRAREIAVGHLRAGRPFIWNASNLSRHIRAECVRLFHEHRARVRIVYVEATPDRLFAQNRQRRRKVPESVIERLLDRWEVPDLTEAHQIDLVLS